MIKNAIRKYIKTKVQMVLCVSKEVDVFQNESIAIFCKRDAFLARGVETDCFMVCDLVPEILDILQFIINRSLSETRRTCWKDLEQTLSA